jgi:hypothetical protein
VILLKEFDFFLTAKKKICGLNSAHILELLWTKALSIECANEHELSDKRELHRSRIEQRDHV